MMLKFGFELEGFYSPGGGLPQIPPKGYPVDGFPGLVELRNSGGGDMDVQYFDIARLLAKYPDIDITRHTWTFSPQERNELRGRTREPKSSEVIQNIYNKHPRALGSKTLASFQINISRLDKSEWWDDKGRFHYPEYGLFDYLPIIRALDIEFSDEIKASGRQPGMYCIKNFKRVEYRSLPNSVTTFNTNRPAGLLTRLCKVLKEFK